jgi:hypothetical protein
MLKIKTQYKGVSVEYKLGTVRVTKKIEDLTEADINTAKKWGVNLGKYFDEVVENTELNIEFTNELPTIHYKAIEVEQSELQAVTFNKPKRKKK